MTSRSEVSRTYTLAQPGPPRPHLPGLQEDDESIDVTSFVLVNRLFVAEGKPNTEDFYLSERTWVALGKPTRIKLTVRPIEETP